MKRNRTTIVACAIATVLGCLLVGCADVQQRSASKKALPDSTQSSDVSAPDGSSAIESAVPAYTINGKRVQLGKPNSNGKVSLLASVSGDLNGDERNDRAIILILNNVGSGVFYHLNVFLSEGKSGWRFVGEEFLGDRIRFDFLDIYAEGSVSSITSIPIHPDAYGKLMVAFSVRSNEQSFAEQPSIYLTKHWQVEDGRLILIDDD